MSTTFAFTADFGDGAAITTATVEVMDATGTIFQTIPQGSLVDVSGNASGRVFGGTATVPDGILSGFYRARDNLSPELILPAEPFNIFQGQASIIVPSPPIPSGFLPSQSVVQAFTTVVLPSGAATDATGTPTGAVERNGVVDGAVAVTVVRTGLGVYSASFIVPAGYVAGDTVALLITATVAGVAAARIIFQAVVVASAAGGPPTSFLTIMAGDTVDLTIPVTPGSLAGRTALRLVVKASSWWPDADADLKVDETAGLILLLGSRNVTPTDASLTGNPSANTVTLHLGADVTAALPPGVLIGGIKADYGAMGANNKDIGGTITFTVTAGRVLDVV